MSVIEELRGPPARAAGRPSPPRPSGVIYGYDLSNIAGALLFITNEFGLTTHQQELVTTAVVIGEIAGALMGGGWPTRSAARSRWSGSPPATPHLADAQRGCDFDARCCWSPACCWA